MNRGFWLGALSLFAVALALVAFATHAAAEVTGPCTGTINGHDIHGEIVVPENGTVAWEFTSTGGPIASWAIELVFLGQTIPIDVGTDEDPDKMTKGGVADVNQYAKYGVGIYTLTGKVVTEGGTCEGAVDVIVQGNPLTTVLGATGAGALVIGGAGGAVAGAAGAKSAAAGFLGVKP